MTFRKIVGNTELNEKRGRMMDLETYSSTHREEEKEKEKKEKEKKEKEKKELEGAVEANLMKEVKKKKTMIVMHSTVTLRDVMMLDCTVLRFILHQVRMKTSIPHTLLHTYITPSQTHPSTHLYYPIITHTSIHFYIHHNL